MTEPPKILTIDDEPSARVTIEALLCSEGYRLSFACGGKEALGGLETDPVDLVICDVMMPGMNGFEVCRQLKAHESLCLVPVILVTALDGRDDLVRGLEAGADEFISKPVEATTLRARVRSMLRIRAQYDRLRKTVPDLDTLLRDRRERLASEAKLSSREREVLGLLLLGRNHQEIGTVLGISPRTSKFHQANVLDKLGADSRVDLIRLFL